MKIIRPYGQSLNANQMRTLVDKEKNTHDIAEFSEQHSELIIAHWVSVIDKIVRKPKQSNGGNPAGRVAVAVTLVQYNLRNILGNAAWEVVKTKLPANAARQPYFDALWRFKIHPYGSKKPPQPPSPIPNTEPKKVPHIKGRWYSRFLGDIAPENVTDTIAASVIEKIRQHLDHNELRFGEESGTRQNGKIPAQAKSISGNVLKQHWQKLNWTEQDKQEYAVLDVATAIYGAAKKDVNEKFSAKSHKIQLSHAGKCLFEHWAKVFKNVDGTVMTIAQAQAAKPSLLALHHAVKACYARLLKHTQKSDAALLKTLPKSTAELYQLLSHQAENRDLASLVQLGKVLYYRDAEKETVDLAKSRFWGSDGQAKIKRAEAFVRVWRHVIGQANLTLAAWASMKMPFESDILGTSKHIQAAIAPDSFDAALFDKNTALVFGNDADFFTGNDDQRKTTLQSAIGGMIDLRNAAFHFKERDTFLKVLKDKLPKTTLNMACIEKLWDAATKKRTARLLATLQGSHAPHYFTQEQMRALINAITADNHSHLPLPRFSRVLERHGNIRSNGLPPTANRNDLEQNPAQKCQYITLKLVYERAFRPWLEQASTAQLNEWITAALKRTTEQAKKMNAKGDLDKQLLISARAEALPRPKAEEDIRQFFFDLSAATASEMRVQRGYESDAEKAQEQAEYIDELLCDVVALAFQAYLGKQQFGWLLALKPDLALPQAPLCAIEQFQIPESSSAAHPWQQALYFLLHLMPVGEVSQLLHQLAKWEITAGRVTALAADEKTLLEALQYTLKLYLDMHDSHYTSTETDGKSMPKVEKETLNAFVDFYENKAAFDLAFPEQGDSGAGAQYLPQRGLREIRRFGHIPVLKALVGQHKITLATVDVCLNGEKISEGKTQSPIAAAQQQREALHKKWALKRDFTDNDCRQYCDALQKVIKHRHAASQSRLVDHVASHRIVLKVLARLVDFSGMYERDLTFVTLALLHDQSVTRDNFFTTKGRDKFDKGQIFEALDNCNTTHDDTKDVLNKLTTHIAYQKDSSKRKTRNNLAHFNMLQSSAGQLKTPLNLTDWINHTRDLVAYDRKLKNAVTKAVQELLRREGIDLEWQMGSDHKLSQATLRVRSASHLGGKKLEQNTPIAENLHSQQLVKILAGAFGGTVKPSNDVSTLQLSTINWQSQQQKFKKKEYANAPQRPNRPK